MRPCRTCWPSSRRRQTRPWQQMVTRRCTTQTEACQCAARHLACQERGALPHVEAHFPVATMRACACPVKKSDFTCALQGVLDILAGLPEHLCDRGALLRHLLAIARSAPAVEQGSVLRELLQRWLPFGKQPKAFVAWAEFLEQCSDAEARNLSELKFL